MYFRDNFKYSVMKKYILAFIISCITLNFYAQESSPSTYYFIRHAEKDRSDKTNKNPELTEKGNNRAKNWSIVFENVDFDLIYSTKYNRTIQTAEPTATRQNIEIQYYSPSQLNDEDFKLKTNGKTVLVVGHSNTTPQFVNDILGDLKYSDIDDKNNANLYVLTILGKTKNCVLIKIPYKK